MHLYAYHEIHSVSVEKDIYKVLSFIADGTDGKQARRTKTSGPLGEMFDHGLDSWATHFMPVCLYSVFDRGEFGIPAERAFALIVCVWAAFIVTHWEKYNTGVLYLPWGYDISQIVSGKTVFLNLLLIPCIQTTDKESL